MLSGVRAASDERAEELIRLGFRRASSPRLECILDATARLAPALIRADARSRPFASLAVILLWERRPHGWVCTRVVSDPSALATTAPPEAMTALDSVDLLAPASALDLRAVRFVAVDYRRRRFVHDRVAVLRPDGSLGLLKPAVPVIPEGRS